MRINSKRIGDLDEFQNIEPPFAAFVLADEGLHSVELRGERFLRKPLRLASFSEKFAESPIASRVNCVWHAESISLNSA